MPVTLPTPDEFAALNWRSRDKAVSTARALLRTYGGQFSDDGYRINRHAADNARWAESVREEARRLEREAKRRARGKR